MASDPSWNFMDPACKERLLGAIRREYDDVMTLARDRDRWQAPTACAGWQVRDIVGHLVDATEGYFPGFDIARNGGTAPEPLGLRAMGRLADDEWMGLMVHHPFMGPAPAGFYPIFQLVDYAVHGWDIREGVGEPHGMAAESADLLVPLIFVLWQATADTTGVDAPYSVGIRTSGNNGGATRFDVSADGVQFAPGDVSDCAAVLDFDPATLVLTGYGRMNGGTVSGDRKVAGRFRSLFFAI